MSIPRKPATAKERKALAQLKKEKRSSKMSTPAKIKRKKK